jgi:molybdopterin-guanine dinucleotide biosynthesis protein A
MAGILYNSGMAQAIGVVLAGGRSRRLGRSKGAMQFRGKSLAERAAAALWPSCGSVLISVGSGAANPAPAFSSVEDEREEGRGPLEGIHAAFRATGDADLLVLACDYPLVDAELMRLIRDAAAEEDDMVIVTDSSGRDHPLVALWRRSLEPVVAGALERGAYRVRSLLADCSVRRLRPRDMPGFDIDGLLVNVNRPADLEELWPI